MSNFYLNVTAVSADENTADVVLAFTYGDIETVAYVARKIDFAGDREYSVELFKTDTIGALTNESRVLELTADGEVSALMLKKKITAARKALAAPAAE